VLGALAKYRHVTSEHLYSVANSHCGYPAGKGIHAGFTSISQNQSQVGTVHGDDEARHSGPSSDIHDRPSDADKSINKLA
jgi:hypothetical protein